MASFEETGPRNPVTESIRVDKVHPRARFLDNARAIFVLILALIGLIPVLAMGLTAFKSRADVVAVPPKIAFEPTLEGFVFLLTERSQLSGTKLEEAKANADDLGLFGQIALRNGQRINGPSDYVTRLWNSLIIASSGSIRPAPRTRTLLPSFAMWKTSIPKTRSETAFA